MTTITQLLLVFTVFCVYGEEGERFGSGWGGNCGERGGLRYRLGAESELALLSSSNNFYTQIM